LLSHFIIALGWLMMHETHKQFAAELDVCAKAAVRIVPLPRPAAFSEPRPLERALSGVFVDHVQDYLDPGIVKPSDHLLEFGEGKIGHVRVAALRREERNRVVAPVVLPLLYRPPHAPAKTHAKSGDGKRCVGISLRFNDIASLAISHAGRAIGRHSCTGLTTAGRFEATDQMIRGPLVELALVEAKVCCRRNRMLMPPHGRSSALLAPP
jgi:hypothetical protein